MEIAARAEKEVRYHLRHAAQWLVRLGDGTAESHQKAQQSLDDLWRYTGEMFDADAVDGTMMTSFDGPDLDAIAAEWQAKLEAVAAEATLRLPADTVMAGGGKQGRHTEHFGFLIAEMQILPRTYPGATW